MKGIDSQHMIQRLYLIRDGATEWSLSGSNIHGATFRPEKTFTLGDPPMRKGTSLMPSWKFDGAGLGDGRQAAIVARRQPGGNGDVPVGMVMSRAARLCFSEPRSIYQAEPRDIDCDATPSKGADLPRVTAVDRRSGQRRNSLQVIIFVVFGGTAWHVGAASVNRRVAGSNPARGATPVSPI